MVRYARFAVHDDLFIALMRSSGGGITANTGQAVLQLGGPKSQGECRPRKKKVGIQRSRKK